MACTLCRKSLIPGKAVLLYLWEGVSEVWLCGRALCAKRFEELPVGSTVGPMSLAPSAEGKEKTR